jgi:hypothetical protein
MPKPVNPPITTSPNTPYQPYDAADTAASTNAIPFRKLRAGPLSLDDGSQVEAQGLDVGGWKIAGTPRPDMASHQSDGVAGMPRGGWMQT